MSTVLVYCNFCKKTVEKAKGRYNEGIKFGWKTYCSLQCLGKARTRRVLLDCARIGCNNSFWRMQKEIKGRQTFYCSRSCAATVNNVKFPKRIAKTMSCFVCGKIFTENKKFCSRKCKDTYQTVNRDNILTWISNFYEKNERIPLKRECPHEKAARKIFGVWNKAIEVAGFPPNPVVFSEKFIAKDGHKCDSLAEKIIDDWFNSKKISHQIHVRYDGTKFTTDFLVGKTYIEFFGLEGQLKRYDKLMREKMRLIARHNLKLVSIYPADLFPKPKLDILLKDFVQST